MHCTVLIEEECMYIVFVGRVTAQNSTPPAAAPEAVVKISTCGRHMQFRKDMRSSSIDSLVQWRLQTAKVPSKKKLRSREN